MTRYQPRLALTGKGGRWPNYDYQLRIVGSVYKAYDNLGNLVAVNSTPDIGALMNTLNSTISSVLGTGGVVTIELLASGASSGSVFTSATTFTPLGLVSYNFVSTRPYAAYWTYTGSTGYAIDGSVNWTTTSNGAYLYLKGFKLNSTATASGLINLGNCMGFTFNEVTMSCSNVSGSRCISDTVSHVANGDEGRFVNTNLFNADYGFYQTSFEHTRISNMEANGMLYSTVSLNGTYSEMWINGVHYLKNGNEKQSVIYDNRAASGGYIDTLVMLHIANEGNSYGPFTSVNGAPYILVADTYGTAGSSVFQTNLKMFTGTTGSGSAALGSNCPASTVSAPYTWMKMTGPDGSTVYVPAWK